MRLIYTDEAGTSEQEPVVVVAAVVVDEKSEAELLEAEIARVVSERVPAPLRDGFYIHATDIFHGKKGMRDHWAGHDRLDFLKEIACLPFVHDIPIAVSYSEKLDFTKILDSARPGRPRMTSNQYNHFLAFGFCMERADFFLKKYLGGKEKGIVLAEAVSQMQGLLTKHGLWLRDVVLQVPIDGQMQGIAEQRLNEPPLPQSHHIENIIDQPKFLGKGEASLLQLADVIAFSFRRFATKQSHGSDLVNAILGPEEGPATTNVPVWFSAANHGLFNTDSYLCERGRADRDFRRRIATGNVLIADADDPDWMKHFADDIERSKRVEGFPDIGDDARNRA
ncbi:hypothetical protein BWQ93_04305 [Sphingopyxis sp. QXT-31]|uniref:DUF3800 domain-containing protein n=1 Tax=Sphingopyxis sp. QXT-31 TaxID=1357916 RepID=UPI0009791D69|nr:DUF3800 domain-containing protein [Sphingopyxis sp. QXT-31]APZ97796.1 hypothetical protein BWQ93_04305 [Sphingopyxis sp. QXT-31]